MEYKVGDVVRIKPASEILKCLDKNKHDPNGVYYNEDMINNYSGEIFTIERVCGDDAYRLDGIRWLWTSVAFQQSKKVGRRVSKRYVEAYTIWQNMMEDGFPPSSYIAKFFDDIKYSVPHSYDADGASGFEYQMCRLFIKYIRKEVISPTFYPLECRKWAKYLAL